MTKWKRLLDLTVSVNPVIFPITGSLCIVLITMPKDNRITQRNRHSYRTKSNRLVKVRTPGGKLLAHTLAKKAAMPKCGDCKAPLRGLPNLRPHKYANLTKNKRTVCRAYGASRCGDCVRQRIVRAFLIEEQRIVKRVLKAQQSAAKAEKK